MITIGATAEGIKTKNYDGTAFSKWNDGLKDRFNTDYKPPAEPALLPPPTPSGSADVSPLTQQDIAKMTAAYSASGFDTNVGWDTGYQVAAAAKDVNLPFLGGLIIKGLATVVDGVGQVTKRPTVETEFAGAKYNGPKDITCPITNKEYGQKTWEQYGNIVKDW